MSYFINISGDTLYLLDTTSKKCGVFNNGSFVGFSSWMDKVWSFEVGVVGVVSCGSRASLIVNNRSEVVECSALDCAREIKRLGGISYTLVMRGGIDSNKVNGYVFVYRGGESVAEEVRRKCNF